MDDDLTPTLHVVAGPNGAGKTTFYELHLKPLTNSEFVNADLLALEHFGHVASTPSESAKGQALAEARRATLLRERRSFVVESTFSHPSKLALLDAAREAGYRIIVYHLNVRDPDHAVQRVRNRVAKGGHPVPEDKIRARYARNQPLIREAIIQADHGFVFDSSQLGHPPALVLRFARGLMMLQADDLPSWAKSLYGVNRVEV